MKKVYTLLFLPLLVLTQTAIAETEPNNWALTANQTTIGLTENGHIIPGTDNNDWWKFDVTETGTLNISLTATITGFPQVLIDLFHEEDTVNRVAYTNLGVDPFVLPFATMPGRYYLRIRTESPECDYSFTTSFTPTLYAADGGEQNGLEPNAIAVSSNPFTGAIKHYCGVVALNNGFNHWDINDWWVLNTLPGPISFFIEKDAANELHVEVYESTNTSSGAWIASGILTNDTTTIFATAGSGNYKLKVWNETAYGSYRITHSMGTGISALSETDFNLYPNPSTGIFTLAAPLAKATELSVMNTVGETIFTSTINSEKATVDLSTQPAGMYFATLISEEGTVRRAIVIE